MSNVSIYKNVYNSNIHIMFNTSIYSSKICIMFNTSAYSSKICNTLDRKTPADTIQVAFLEY